MNYFMNEDCKNEIKEIKAINPPRLTIPVFIDSNENDWCDQELKYLLQLRSETQQRYNISQVLTDESWQSSVSPTEEVCAALYKQIDDLAMALKNSLR